MVNVPCFESMFWKKMCLTDFVGWIIQILIGQIILICLGWLLVMTLVEDFWMGHGHFATLEGWQELFLVQVGYQSWKNNPQQTDAPYVSRCENWRCSKLQVTDEVANSFFLAVCISLGLPTCGPTQERRCHTAAKSRPRRGQLGFRATPASWFCFPAWLIGQPCGRVVFGEGSSCFSPNSVSTLWGS